MGSHPTGGLLDHIEEGKSVVTVPKSGTEWLKRRSITMDDGRELPVTQSEAAAVNVEAWLQGHGVKYAPPLDLPMILIDEKRSRSNQARKDPIVAESVDRFAAAIKAGHEFPPIVTYLYGGKLVIIDGNNRQAAARKAGRDTIWGIVISEETPSELIALLTVEANAHHGVTPDANWRLLQAFHLVSLGFTDIQAAQAAAVTPAQISNARKVREADQRAGRMKIGRFAELPAGSRQLLAGLKDDSVFFQAAKTAVDTAMNLDEVRSMCREVRTKTSEGARVEYIGALARERGLEAAARKVMGRALNRVNSPKQSLVAAIGKLLAVNEAALVRAVMTRHERDLVNVRLSAASDKLLALMVAMEQLKDMEDVEDEG